MASHWRALALLATLGAAAALAATPRMSAATLTQPLPAVRPCAAPALRRQLTLRSALLEAFVAHFRGHFDNIAQSEADQAAGLEPRQGGGHEHIHCHVQPLDLSPLPSNADEAFTLASYYFNGRPEQLFRERLYAMRELADDTQFGHCVRMRIYQLRPATEEALRTACGVAEGVRWGAADVAEELLIPDADVFWRRVGERFEGHMRTESVTVFSARMNAPIVVRDDVALWRDALWVNDRGADEEGNYLYGNTRDVPYKMARVPETHWTATGDVPDR